MINLYQVGSYEIVTIRSLEQLSPGSGIRLEVAEVVRFPA